MKNNFADRLIGLDFYRIIAVLFIFLFHSNIHFDCNYGLLNGFVNMGAIYMTAFFILSGFALYLTWNGKDLGDIKTIKNFYFKRAVGILPLYYVVSLIYVLFIGKETRFENLLLAPIELLGLQSMFTSIFSATHNSGTWFVSCILFCYMIYPFIQENVKKISIRLKITMIVVSSFILLYSPFIQGYYKTDGSGMYTNPFFRSLEFSIGVLLCSMMKEIKNRPLSKILFSWWAVGVEYIILIAGVTIAVCLNISVGNYMLYSWVALPMFILQIVSMSGLRYSYMDSKPIPGKVIKYLSDISYAFFFAQFFTWKISIKLIELIGKDTNMMRISISLMVCLIISIILHELVEKPIIKTIKNHACDSDRNLA